MAQVNLGTGVARFVIMNELRNGYIVTQQDPEVQIHYVEQNHAAHNPLILFLHGYPDFSYSWHSYLPAMAREGYHALAIDLRGFSESSKPQDRRFYREEYLLRDVEIVLDHFPDKPVYLTGHGLGAYLAVNLARLLPERVHGLILMHPHFPSASDKKLLPRALDEKVLTPHELEAYQEIMADPRTTFALRHRWGNLFHGPVTVPTLLFEGQKEISLKEETFTAGLTRHHYPRGSYWFHLERAREIQNEMLYFISHTRLAGHKNVATYPESTIH